MPRCGPSTCTYLAVREHPECGLLLKVGKSGKPEKRCKDLGAKRFGPLMHPDLESELKAKLSYFRVWKRQHGIYFLDGPNPIFSASSEWFYANEKTRRIIARIIERERKSGCVG